MSSIEFIARAIIEKDGKILLCHGLGKPNWFFPGGHIESGESAPEALLREIEEELGVSGTIVRFLGASENKFELKGESVQEINLVFEVVLDEQGSMMSKEDHIEFAWFTREEMGDLLVFPMTLRDAIIENSTIKPLWVSEGFVGASD